MSESVFKGTEIVGTSDQSFSHAIEVAVQRARASLRNLSWFVVKEQRGGLQQGRLEYQVTLCVSFKLDSDAQADAATDDVVGEKKDKSAKKKNKKRS
jgi:flavin-binding protein dodecin